MATQKTNSGNNKNTNTNKPNDTINVKENKNETNVGEGDNTPQNTPPEPSNNETPKVEDTTNTSPTPESKLIPSKEDEAPEESEIMKLIGELRNDGTVQEQSLIAGIEGYISKMSPGIPMTGEQGIVHQFGLWNLLKRTVNNSGEKEFKKLWNIVLGFFHEYEKGVFSERYVLRFMDQRPGSNRDLRDFQRLIDLLKLTSNPATRTVTIQAYSMDKLLETKNFTDAGKQKLVTFYS